MILGRRFLSWFPRPVLQALLWLETQRWAHWVVSLIFGPIHNVMGVIYRVAAWFYPVGIWKDWQHRPQPKFPLPGIHNDIPVKTSHADFCGQYLTTMVATYTDAKALAETLPRDVELDPAHIHDGKHAVVYMFGYTENLRAVWDPLPGFNYVEFAIGIPSVRIVNPNKGGYKFPFLYLPHLWLSRLYPTILGWNIGYQKSWGWVWGANNCYHIRSFSGKRIVDAEFTILPGHDQVSLADGKTQPNLQHWKDLLDQPQVNPLGNAELLFLHYHWGWSNALLQPVAAEVVVHNDVPGLPAGKYSFPPIDATQWNGPMAPIGAFRLCAPFELLLPFPRKVLEDYTMPVISHQIDPTTPDTPNKPTQTPDF